jgi:hypothetical protein
MDFAPGLRKILNWLTTLRAYIKSVDLSAIDFTLWKSRCAFKHIKYRRCGHPFLIEKSARVRDKTVAYGGIPPKSP